MQDITALLTALQGGDQEQKDMEYRAKMAQLLDKQRTPETIAGCMIQEMAAEITIVGFREPTGTIAELFKDYYGGGLKPLLDPLAQYIFNKYPHSAEDLSSVKESAPKWKHEKAVQALFERVALDVRLSGNTRVEPFVSAMNAEYNRNREFETLVDGLVDAVKNISEDYVLAQPQKGVSLTM